jgi:hypothetical protein
VLEEARPRGNTKVFVGGGGRGKEAKGCALSFMMFSVVSKIIISDYSGLFMRSSVIHGLVTSMRESVSQSLSPLRKPCADVSRCRTEPGRQAKRAKRPHNYLS